MLTEALVLTGIVRFSILFISFNKLAGHIGEYREESTYEVTDVEKDTIKKVTWCVDTISKRTPWQSMCLVQALTAQLMLKHRKISSTLYLGVAKTKNGKDKKLKAHAWLRCGMDIITGDSERKGFTVVAKFANHALGGDKS